MRQFAKAFRSPDNEVDVIAVRRSHLPRNEVIDGVNVYRIQNRSPVERSRISHILHLGSFLFRAAAIITWKHWRKPYDVIHVQSIPDFLVFSALIPKLLGCPVILDLRDLVPELYASKFKKKENCLAVRILKRVERLSARFADHVIVANPLWYERVVQRSAIASKCSVFWYYPDTELFYPRQMKRTDNRFRLLYPGSLQHHQGVDLAIRALSKIQQEIPEVELHIQGDGPAKADLLKLSQELHLEAKVIFDELVPFELVSDCMAECNLGLVPKMASDVFGNEAASTKIPEFMAVGIPVVASRTKIESYLYDDSLLCYFESENEDSFVNAVTSLYKDSSLRNSLVNNGRQFVEKNNWATRVPEYIDLVKSLVK